MGRPLPPDQELKTRLQKGKTMNRKLITVMRGGRMKTVFILLMTTLFDPTYSNSQDVISSKDIAPLFGSWEGTLTNSNTGYYSICRIIISDSGVTDRVKVSYFLSANKNRPAVQDSQECPVLERKGHLSIEYTTTTTNNTYYFYLQNGKLVSATDSANYAVMKYELSKR